MLSPLRTLLSRTGQDRGFTLVELLIVVLIVGVLAAVAAPLYLGYVKDAEAAEDKSWVGAIRTSLQARAAKPLDIPERSFWYQVKKLKIPVRRAEDQIEPACAS
jgi:prepilin-type N-terminal cleavage/methylation domain-containing protein